MQALVGEQILKEDAKVGSNVVMWSWVMHTWEPGSSGFEPSSMSFAKPIEALSWAVCKLLKSFSPTFVFSAMFEI